MITLIGDVHGKYDKYKAIVDKNEYTIQLGDFGFSSHWRKLMEEVDPFHHLVISGNHDCYDTAFYAPHYMGNFGVNTLNDVEFFHIRGGISIDRVYRVGEELTGGPKTWWSQEEMNFTEMLACMEEYRKAKPRIVLSHAPPGFVCDVIHGNKHNILQKFKFHHGFKENTSLLGDELFKIHKPQYWVFGHHHRSWKKEIDGTTFICLNELETMSIE